MPQLLLKSTLKKLFICLDVQSVKNGFQKRISPSNHLPIHDVSQGLKTKWLFHSTILHISSAIVQHSTRVHISDGSSVIHKRACNVLLWVRCNYDVKWPEEGL